MIPDVQMRFAVEADVPLILAFIKEIAEFERLSHEVTATEESLRDSLFGGNSSPEVVLCFQNEKPVAYAVFYHNFSTFIGRKGLYLEDIYVKPEHRHSGIGRQLFKFLTKVAVERKCGRMEWAVLNWNRPAIRFYESMSARPLTEWTLFRMQEDQIKKVAK
jgi:GNAT superfamily N-acetyltransferase